MKTLFLCTIALALSACGSLNLENRVACTMAKDKALYISEYQSIGIASEISPKDAAVLCK